jgi:hypothetical protein
VLELELASGGDLFDFIAYPQENKFPEQVALYFFKQVSIPKAIATSTNYSVQLCTCTRI